MERDIDKLLASLSPEYYDQAQGFRIPGVSEMSPMSNPDVPMQVAPPLAKTPQRAPAVVPQAAPQQDARAIVEPYIKKKFDLGEYSDENRKALVEKNGEYDFGGRLSAAAAALGAGLMGGNAAGAGQGMLSRMDAEKKGKLDAFDKGRTGVVEKFNLDEAANKVGLEDDKFNRESDLGSEETKLAQTLANKMAPGVDFSGLTARQINEKIPSLQKLYDIEQRKLEVQSRDADRRMMLGDRREAKDQARQDKLDLAAKPSDKQIEAFTDFDNAESDLTNLLGSLGDNSNWTGPIDGRTPDLLVGDDQVAWRSAVGKYKDAYRKAITGAGAGPREIAILEKRLPSETDTLANFKAKAKEAQQELQRRKQTLAENLTRGGKNVSQFMEAGASPRKPSGDRQVVKKQVNKKTGQTKLIYSDGSEEIQ